MKKILFAALLAALATLTSFSPASKVPVSNVKPTGIITVEHATTLSNSDNVRVVFYIDQSSYVISQVKVYYVGNPIPCLEYIVTGYSGGPITFAGGHYRTFHSITVTTTSGTATVTGILTEIINLCD